MSYRNQNEDVSGFLIVAGIVAFFAYLMIKSGADATGLDIPTLVETGFFICLVVGAAILASRLGKWREFWPFLPGLFCFAMVPACNYWAGGGRDEFFRPELPWYGNGWWQFLIIVFFLGAGAIYSWIRSSNGRY